MRERIHETSDVLQLCNVMVDGDNLADDYEPIYLIIYNAYSRFFGKRNSKGHAGILSPHCLLD